MTKIKRLYSRRKFVAQAIVALGVVATSDKIIRAQNIDDFLFVFEEVELELPRLDPAFDGYTLAQLSDIHYDGVGMKASWLRKIVATVNEREVDTVLLTGDYALNSAQNFNRLAPEMASIVADLQAKDARLAVQGNHDHRYDVGVSLGMVTDAAFTDLTNTVYTIERGNALLHFAGLDSYNNGIPDIYGVLAQLPDAGAAVSVVHEPDYADISAPTGRFDLQVSGHSHGGQIRNIKNEPIRLPPHGRRYHSGLYQVGTMLQYTNRGLGTTPPHIRINCTPEVTIYTLRSPFA